MFVFYLIPVYVKIALNHEYLLAIESMNLSPVMIHLMMLINATTINTNGNNKRPIILTLGRSVELNHVDLIFLVFQ